MMESRGSNHNRGVMIPFKPRLDISIQKTESVKNGRYIICEGLIDGKKFIFINIYYPSVTSEQLKLSIDLSMSCITNYVNDKKKRNVILTGDLCELNRKRKEVNQSTKRKKFQAR